MGAHPSKGRSVGRFCRWGYEDVSTVLGTSRTSWVTGTPTRRRGVIRALVRLL
jgi:hypothetical protein